MADAEPHGVKINLISSRKLDTMTSEEKLRFILDEVKKGSVLVLERGLTAEEEIDLIKATMSEINHNTFIGIEMQSYSSNDLETSSWLSRILGRSRVPKMSVIGPASLLKTIHKDGSMIQTMVLTGESISREMTDEPIQESDEEIQEPEGEFGSEPEVDTELAAPYDGPEEGDVEAESSETSVAPEQILTPPEPPEDVPNDEPIEPSQETNYPPPETNFDPEPAPAQETSAPDYYDDSTPTDQDYSVPVEPAPKETPPQEPAEAKPLSLDDLETARGTMEYAEPYDPPTENSDQLGEERTDGPIEGTEPNESQEQAQQETTEYLSESPGETAEQEPPNENPEDTLDQETESESKPPEDPQQESVGFLYRRLKTEEE